jgi:hypothetical protein
MGPDYRVLTRRGQKEGQKYYLQYKEEIPVSQLVVYSNPSNPFFDPYNPRRQMHVYRLVDTFRYYAQHAFVS